MKYRNWIVVAVVLGVVAIGGLVISSTPDLEVNVSGAAGYQGLADVAADPADPESLLIVGVDDGEAGPRAWLSPNGGGLLLSTVLPMTFDGHAFAESSEPTVTVDRNGVWYAAYEVHDLDGGLNPIDSSVVVARSYDGMVWEAASFVEDNRGAGADPSVETPHVAVDAIPNGCTSYSNRLLIVWVRKTGTDRAIYRNYSTNQAATWSTSVKINDGSSGAEDVWRPQDRHRTGRHGVRRLAGRSAENDRGGRFHQRRVQLDHRRQRGECDTRLRRRRLRRRPRLQRRRPARIHPCPGGGPELDHVPGHRYTSDSPTRSYLPTGWTCWSPIP